MSVKLYSHQIKALEETKKYNKVAYYHDMGLGKTFTGSEKLISFKTKCNLVVCQKSKIRDWVEHFKSNYPYQIFNLTDSAQLAEWYALSQGARFTVVGVINYELAYRRSELTEVENFTLLLDESSLIQNENAKRSKFILKLQPTNVILLSGTPTGGRYERLWSQLRLLGWDISKKTFWNMFIEFHFEDFGGVPVKMIDGYKNVERLKTKMRQYGCHFLKTDEVLDLPEQMFTNIEIPISTAYKKFRKNKIVEVDGETIVGENSLTAMLCERQLCGQYSTDKLEAFKDLIESTEDRLIVFYNFNEELYHLAMDIERPISIVNGKTKDLSAYENFSNSITFIQYQAGAMGLNLQKANKVIYFTPPLSSELYEQSKKRINRIGQERPCYYYKLLVKDSVEEKIYKALDMRRDYTLELFEEGE